MANAAGAISPDNNESVVVIVIRGAEPPPNRRIHGGMIIGNLTVTGLIISILLLAVLLILVGVVSYSKHFKFGQIKQVIPCGGNIARTIGRIARVISIFGYRLHHGPKVSRKRRHQAIADWAGGGASVSIQGFPFGTAIPATSIGVGIIHVEIASPAYTITILCITQRHRGCSHLSNLEVNQIVAFLGGIVIEPDDENIDLQIAKGVVANFTIDGDFFHITHSPIVGTQTGATHFPNGGPIIIRKVFGGHGHFNRTGFICRGVVIGASGHRNRDCSLSLGLGGNWLPCCPKRSQKPRQTH